jgi:hypothetical protein
MVLHLFRDGDVFAFTVDRTGHNLPCTQESEWRFMETLDGVKFAWGEENFGDVYSPGCGRPLLVRWRDAALLG